MARPTRICTAYCPHCTRAFPVALHELTPSFERPCPACAALVTARRPSLIPAPAERAELDRLATLQPLSLSLAFTAEDEALGALAEFGLSGAACDAPTAFAA